jgi:hypothetical protein
MRGGSTAIPTRKLAELLTSAEERGSLTGAEIAEILDMAEITTDYSSNWSVGGS